MKFPFSSSAQRAAGVLSPVVLLGAMVVLATAFEAPPAPATNSALPDGTAGSGALFSAPGGARSTPGQPGAPILPPKPGQLPGRLPGQIPGQLPPMPLAPGQMVPGQMVPGQLSPAPLAAGMQGDPRLSADFARGVEAQGKGDLASAAAAYREVLQLQPKAMPAHLNLALVLLRQKQADRGIWHLRQAIAIAPRAMQPRAILAQAYINQKQPQKAYEQWTQLASLNPSDKGQAAFYAGAIAFEQLKNPREAETWLRRAATQNKGEDPRLAMLLARVLTARGKASEAAGVLQAASQKFPKITSIHTALAEAQWQSGNKNGAIATLRALEQSTPAQANGGLNLSQVRVMLGRALAQQKQFPEATKALRQALANLPEKSPASGPTRILLAQTLAAQANDEEKRGQTKNAIASWDDAIKIFPDNALGYVQRGRLLAKSGDEKSALNDFNRALKLAPRDPNAIMGAANMEEKTGDAGRALAHWKTLIDNQPDYKPAYYNLARLSAGQKQLAAQMNYLESKIRKNPDFRAPYDAVLEAAEKSGRSELARDWVSSMAKRYPKSSGPRNALIAFDRRNPPTKSAKTPAPSPISTPAPASTPSVTIAPVSKPTSKPIATPKATPKTTPQSVPSPPPGPAMPQPAADDVASGDGAVPQIQ